MLTSVAANKAQLYWVFLQLSLCAVPQPLGNLLCTVALDESKNTPVLLLDCHSHSDIRKEEKLNLQAIRFFLYALIKIAYFLCLLDGESDITILMAMETKINWSDLVCKGEGQEDLTMDESFWPQELSDVLSRSL